MAAPALFLRVLQQESHLSEKEGKISPQTPEWGGGWSHQIIARKTKAHLIRFAEQFFFKYIFKDVILPHK